MDLQQHSTICKGCWQNLHFPVVLRGPLAIPFRVVGLRPSRMNPNTCTFCELAFRRVMKARNVTIDATVLFADLRGYTTASESLASSEIASTLDAFYDECAEAIWEHDGLLNGGLQFPNSTERSRRASGTCRPTDAAALARLASGPRGGTQLRRRKPVHRHRHQQWRCQFW
jgi:hypothetical protein